MRKSFGLFFPVALCASMSVAGEFDDALNALAQDRIAAIASDPAIISAIRAQNEVNSGLSEAEILDRDKKWRANVSSDHDPIIHEVVHSKLAARLREIRDESQGLFTEIFLMDSVGLNVAASDVTSDYWQGDEAKWQETYGAGAEKPHLSEVELDESTQTYQSQISMIVIDPDSSEPLGAITFGVDVSALE